MEGEEGGGPTTTRMRERQAVMFVPPTRGRGGGKRLSVEVIPTTKTQRSGRASSARQTSVSEHTADGSTAMEALEAQRLLQSTLPQFLERVDPSYKVPFNFKLRAEGTHATDDSALLVPLGSFNPVPKILNIIQSNSITEARDALQADCDNMDQAMQIIVDAYYNGFNKSLASYGHILRHISSSKESVRTIQAQLADVKTSLNIRSKELRKLWLRKTEYTETLRILDELEEVNAGWELVERHVQMKDWVAAARILTRCVRIVEQEEVKQIGAIYDIRIALTDLYSKFHSQVIDELHQIIYLKSITLEQSPSQTAQYITALVDSLCIAKRVKEGIEALSSRVNGETRAIIDSSISSILVQYQEKRSASSPISPHSSNIPLENLLRSLFAKCVKILSNHKQVIILLRSLSESVVKDQMSLYNLRTVWEAIQEELVALLRIYLAASAPATIDSSDIEGTLQRKLFSFADSSAATYNVTSSKEGASAFAALQLFSPSPSNVTVVYPLLYRFYNEVSGSVLGVINTEIHKEKGRLLEFMDEFIEQVYLPHIRSNYRSRLNSAVESSDAFKPRERQRTINGEVQNWPRSVVYCVTELATIIHDATQAMTSLPAYAHLIIEVIEDMCLSFQRRCAVAYEDVTEGSLAARIVSNSLVPPQLARDPLWKRLIADIRHEGNMPKEKQRERGFSALSPREKRMLQKPSVLELHISENLGTRRAGSVTLTPAYLYEGEDKFYNENPVARTDLLFDTGRLLHLAYLTESLEWLAEELASVQYRSRHNDTELVKSNDERRKDRKNSVAPGPSLSTTINGFSSIADRCLFVLKVESRLHAFFFLDGLQRCSYIVDDETPEPDGCVVELTKDLGTLDSILSRVLSQPKLMYVLGGLERLITAIIIRSLPRIKGFNSNGVWKMCRNVFALEQTLSQLGYSGDGAGFESARQYYRLLSLTPDELFAHLLQPTRSVNKDGHQVPGERPYALGEYQALLEQLEKSPAYQRFNLDHLRKQLTSA